MIRYAKNRLINSVWTLKYEILSGDKIRILSYNRNDPMGYDHEHELDDHRMIEDKDRVVHAVEVMNNKRFMSDLETNVKLYTVINPQHIFTYKENENELS